MSPDRTFARQPDDQRRHHSPPDRQHQHPVKGWQRLGRPQLCPTVIGQGAADGAEDRGQQVTPPQPDHGYIEGGGEVHPEADHPARAEGTRRQVLKRVGNAGVHLCGIAEESEQTGQPDTITFEYGT